MEPFFLSGRIRQKTMRPKHDENKSIYVECLRENQRIAREDASLILTAARPIKTIRFWVDEMRHIYILYTYTQTLDISTGF